MFYKKNKHLPGIASAKNIVDNGLKITDTMEGMMLNVEENRLDITALFIKLEELKEENKKLQKELIRMSLNK